jgi:hypothetical protein
VGLVNHFVDFLLPSFSLNYDIIWDFPSSPLIFGDFEGSAECAASVLVVHKSPTTEEDLVVSTFFISIFEIKY